MNCPRCHTPHSNQAIFCQSCGKKFEVIACPYCHESNRDTSNFCIKCGVDLRHGNESVVVPTELVNPVHNTSSERVIPEPRATLMLRYAGFWIRFAAYVVDELILGFVSLLIAGSYAFYMYRVLNHVVSISPFASNSFASDFPYDHAQMFSGTIALAVGWFQAYIIYLMGRWVYYSVMESSKKQATLGKLLFGLQVTDLNGNRISFGRAVGRHFSKLISNLTFAIGYILAGFTERKQALHDIIANCLVIKK